jgi:hypothetical protein
MEISKPIQVALNKLDFFDKCGYLWVILWVILAFLDIYG